MAHLISAGTNSERHITGRSTGRIARLSRGLHAQPARQPRCAGELRRWTDLERITLWTSIAILVLTTLGCTTEQFASLVESDDSRSATRHCLASLGFWENDEYFRTFRASDPSLFAVWSTHPRGATKAGTTVWIHQNSGTIRLRFLPGAGEDSPGTSVLARSFVACMPQHVAGVEVELTSRTSLDLR